MNSSENNDSIQVSPGKGLSLYISICAAKGLQDILKNNLGPDGTMKILVTSSGEIKLSKDGSYLLNEMQIQNPTGSLIARTIMTQKSYIGDGATSMVILIGQTLRNIEKYLEKGIHPQILCDGIDLTRMEIERWLPTQILKQPLNRKTLIKCAKTVIETKIKKNLSEKISNIAVDAVLTLYNQGKIVDLERIEILQVNTKTESDSKWIKGLVLDHGARHPDMPKIIYNASILLCNINLEHEKSETNSSFIYNSVENKEKISLSERDVIDNRVNKIIQLKRLVCTEKNKGFVLINQKGIDTLSLDLLAKEGILGIRRAKRKNMERVSLLCNCIPINSINDLKTEVLGFTGIVYEQLIGEEKYTFFENVSNPFSGTILIKGKSSFIRKQIENSILNAMKTLKTGIKDNGFLKGAGGIELLLQNHLIDFSKNIPGKKKYGVRAFASAITSIPRTLYENSGFKIESLSDCVNVYEKLECNIKSKIAENILYLDSFSVKKNVFTTVCFIIVQILLIDEIYFGKGLA